MWFLAVSANLTKFLCTKLVSGSEISHRFLDKIRHNSALPQASSCVCVEQLCHHKFSEFFMAWCPVSFQSMAAVFDVILPHPSLITRDHRNQKHLGRAGSECGQHALQMSSFLFFYKNVTVFSLFHLTEMLQDVFSPHESTNPCLLIVLGITGVLKCCCSWCTKQLFQVWYSHYCHSTSWNLSQQL